MSLGLGNSAPRSGTSTGPVLGQGASGAAVGAGGGRRPPPDRGSGGTRVGPSQRRDRGPSSRLIRAVDLLRELVARDIKVRYKRSFLGIAWTLLNPLAQMLVLSFVFTQVLPLNIPDYPAFVFTGLLAFTWFQASVLSASASVLDHGTLIRQPGFPVAILPAVPIATHLVHFLLALIVLLPFLALTGHQLTPALLLLPVLIAIQFVLSLGLGYLTAPLQVVLRDTQHTLGVIMMLGFYLTPVFYDLKAVPSEYLRLYYCNPMVTLIDAYRDILGVSPLRATGFDVRLMSWGDGTGVPPSGSNLVVVGTDSLGRLHIRAFNSSGSQIIDTDETNLPSSSAVAITAFKARFPNLLPPYVLPAAEKSQVISDVTSIVGQTRATWPASTPLIILAGISAALLGVGYGLYRRASGSFVEVL